MQRSKLDKWKGGYHLLCNRRHTTRVPFVSKAECCFRSNKFNYVFTDVNNIEIKGWGVGSQSGESQYKTLSRPSPPGQLTLLKNRQFQTPLNWKISTEKIKSYARGNDVRKLSKGPLSSVFVVNLATIYPLFSCCIWNNPDQVAEHWLKQ